MPCRYWKKVREKMGTIRNEMTIVHHWNRDELEKVRKDAIKEFGQIISPDIIVEDYVNECIENMISPIMKSYVNQEYTFAINGDCSKIGWKMSEQFHEARIKWCEKHKYDVQNIIVINFGEDDPCYIVFDNKGESEKHVNKIYFEVTDDTVIKHTAMPEIGENIYKNEIVMTKEIFQECYKKWIMPEENEDKE